MSVLYQRRLSIKCPNVRPLEAVFRRVVRHHRQLERSVLLAAPSDPQVDGAGGRYLL